MKLIELTQRAWTKIVNRLSFCKREIEKKNAIIKAYEKQIRDYQKLTEDKKDEK